jgi:hypothetical protein
MDNLFDIEEQVVNKRIIINKLSLPSEDELVDMSSDDLWDLYLKVKGFTEYLDKMIIVEENNEQ